MEFGQKRSVGVVNSGNLVCMGFQFYYTLFRRILERKKDLVYIWVPWDVVQVEAAQKWNCSIANKEKKAALLQF